MAHWTLEEPPIHSVVLDTLEALEQVAGSVPWRLMFSNMALRCEELEQRADGEAARAPVASRGCVMRIGNWEYNWAPLGEGALGIRHWAY